MRAGSLDRSIEIERATNTVDGYGVATESWSTLATLRAQVIEAGTQTEELNRSHGASTEAAVLFRTWFLDGITVADRIKYSGRYFNIKATKELGRRQGLEIRAAALGAS